MENLLQREWKPSKKQELALSLPDTVNEMLYGGAAGPGKTDLLMMIPIARQFIQNPRFKGILFRRTFPELEREFVPRSRDWYSHAGGKYNETKHSWGFSSGATIFLAHLEHEEDVRKHDTSEYNYAAFDELTSFTYYQYIYITATRLRSSTPELPSIVRCGSNPGGIGHGWVQEHFKIGTIAPGTIIKIKNPDNSANFRIFIQAFLTDNPHVDPNYSAKLELLRTVNFSEYRAKKFGDWGSFEGQVFSEFRIKPLPNEPANAQHVIPSQNLPEWYPTVIAIDWGFTAMAYILWAKVCPDGKVIIYREHGVHKQYIEQWASDVARMSQHDNVMDIVIDPSSRQNRGQPLTIYDQVRNALGELGDLLRVADNDRVGGKQLIHEFLRWQSRPQKYLIDETYDEQFALKLLRTQGTHTYNEYRNYFKEDEPDAENLPRLQIFDTCKILIRTIPQLVYDDTNKEDVKETNTDVDDPYDTLRYLLKAVDFYVKNSSDEFEHRQKLAKIVDNLNETKDWNHYYMQMRKFESQSHGTEQVARYGRKRPTMVSR